MKVTGMSGVSGIRIATTWSDAEIDGDIARGRQCSRLLAIMIPYIEALPCRSYSIPSVLSLVGKLRSGVGVFFVVVFSQVFVG